MSPTVTDDKTKSSRLHHYFRVVVLQSSGFRVVRVVVLQCGCTTLRLRLQCVAVCCSGLQPTATHCNTLAFATTRRVRYRGGGAEDEEE